MCRKKKIRTARMSEYVLALVAESKKDVGQRSYVSEGIYAVADALNDDQNTVPRVVSTDILGPTWFEKEEQEFSPGIMTGPGPVTREGYEAGVAAGAIMSLEAMQSRVIDPSWRLTEKAAEVMTDFGFLKQAPILNLLNGFEYMMDNTFRAAAEFVRDAELPEKHRPSWLVDVGFLLKEDQVSIGDVAVARARRIVAIFCYTLIDILKWKRAMTRRVADLNYKPFPSMPYGAPYSSLIAKISDRGKRFVEGTLEEEGVTSTPLGKRYVVPSVTTVLASVIAAGGFSPRIRGSFYEAILGYEIMTELSCLISAEYGALLSRITGQGGPLHGHLEMYVLDPDMEIPSHQVSENEKVWITKERERRSKLDEWQIRAENALKSHEYLGAAIDMEPFLNKDQTTMNETAVKALHREVRHNPEEESVLRVCSRQPFFSNFSVMRVRPVDSSVNLSMHVMWNTLFLATGGLTRATASENGFCVRSRLLLHFFLKDLHALFNCSRCEYGYLVKILDTFSLWENEKMNEGEGQNELIRVLSAALSTLTGQKTTTTTTVGNLVFQILDYPSNNKSLINNNNTAALTLSGKMRLTKEDREMKELFTTNQTAYALEARKYIGASKGFAALAFYCLYASAASSPRLVEKMSSSSLGLDEAVISLLSRWGNEKFPILPKKGEEASSSPLLAFAGVWALRNAVRARRNVHDATNSSFIPGHPLTLLEALPVPKSISALLSNKYVQPKSIDSENLVWEAIAEMETESEVWLSSGSRKRARRRQTNIMTLLQRAELVKEPAGVIPVTSSVTVLFPKRNAVITQQDNNNKKKRVVHPLATLGKISLSIDDLKSFTKETYAKIPSFPITTFDYN